MRSAITDDEATSSRKVHASGVQTGAPRLSRHGQAPTDATPAPLQRQLPDDCSGGMTA
jgi:hypothetical protein